MWRRCAELIAASDDPKPAAEEVLFLVALQRYGGFHKFEVPVVGALELIRADYSILRVSGRDLIL